MNRFIFFNKIYSTPINTMKKIDYPIETASRFWHSKRLVYSHQTCIVWFFIPLGSTSRSKAFGHWNSCTMVWHCGFVSTWLTGYHTIIGKKWNHCWSIKCWQPSWQWWMLNRCQSNWHSSPKKKLVHFKWYYHELVLNILMGFFWFGWVVECRCVCVIDSSDSDYNDF